VSAIAPERQRLRLDLEGMTCASCAARIEQRLNRLDNVEATVNYATEAASVAFASVKGVMYLKGCPNLVRIS